MVYKDLRLYDFKNKPKIIKNPCRMQHEICKVRFFKVLINKNCYLMVGDGLITLWNLGTHKLLKMIDCKEFLAFALSDDEKYFVVSYYLNKQIVIYDISFRKILMVRSYVENMNFHSLKRLECFNLNHKVYLDIFWQNIMKRKGNQIKVWESNGYFYSVQGDDEKKIISKKDSLEYLDIVSNKLIFSANRIAP